MSLTPLFTASELDAAITALKSAYLSLAAGTVKEHSVDTGLIRKTYVKRDLVEIEGSLEYLQKKRAELEIGIGAQVLIGRPAR